MSSDKKVSEQAYAYTPGLKVKRNMEVIKRRQLPLEGEALVKVGDEVEYDTIVAKTYVKGDPEIVKVAALLGFRTTPEDVEAYLLKNIRCLKFFTLRQCEIVHSDNNFVFVAFWGPQPKRGSANYSKILLPFW